MCRGSGRYGTRGELPCSYPSFCCRGKHALVLMGDHRIPTSGDIRDSRICTAVADQAEQVSVNLIIPEGMWPEIVARMKEGHPILLEGSVRYPIILVWMK